MRQFFILGYGEGILSTPTALTQMHFYIQNNDPDPDTYHVKVVSGLGTTDFEVPNVAKLIKVFNMYADATNIHPDDVTSLISSVGGNTIMSLGVD